MYIAMIKRMYGRLIIFSSLLLGYHLADAVTRSSSFSYYSRQIHHDLQNYPF